MLGPSPCWDQMQNSKNAHPHAKIRCQTPFCFAEPFSLDIVLESKHFFPLLKNDVSAYWIPFNRKKGGCCGPDMLKNKLQIPETHKKTGFNVLTSFQVLYPSAIVIRDVLLRPLLFQPHCCVRGHQSWRCTACSSSTIIDKEDVTSRTKHSATEISCWCNACFSSQYKMSVLAWVMITGIKAEGILNKRKQMNDGCFLQASDVKSRWALWCGGRLPPSGHISHSRLQVAITTPKTCQVTIQWWRHTARHFQAERCSEFVPYPIQKVFHHCYNGCWIKEYCTAADVQQMAKSVQFTAFKLSLSVPGASDLF